MPPREEPTTYASARVRDSLTWAVVHACAPLVGFGVLDVPDVRGVVLVVAGVVLAVLGIRRARSVRVEAGEEGLTVRNLFRTHRLRWDEVERFGRRRPFLVGLVCPVAVSARGTVTLLAMPVEQRRRGRPPRPFKDAAVVEGWATHVAGAR